MTDHSTDGPAGRPDPETPCLNCGYHYSEHDNRWENAAGVGYPDQMVWIEGCPVLYFQPSYFEGGVNVYVTFGSKHRHERHPREHWVHPDGWLRVVATASYLAREMVINLLGLEWAFEYPEGDFQAHYHELGELAVLTRKGLRLTEVGTRTLLYSYDVIDTLERP